MIVWEAPNRGLSNASYKYMHLGFFLMEALRGFF